MVDIPSGDALGHRIAVSAAMLFLTAPLLLVTALAVKLESPGPVLYRQERVGLRGASFTLLKFRSMRVDAERDGKPQWAAQGDSRVTHVGAFIRKVRIDELPQLFNVLRGDMSLIGPRPLLMEYLSRYTPAQARRQTIRPGVTGWAQVNGRNAIGWEEKFALDVWYVDHVSPLLDLRILWMTALRVFGRTGISSKGHATMPEFMGSELEP